MRPQGTWIGVLAAMVALVGPSQAAAQVPGYIDVRLQVLADPFPFVGMSSSTIHFPHGLTPTERSSLRVSVTNPSPQRIVVGTTRLRNHRRDLEITVAAAWIATKTGRKVHPSGLNATAQMPDGGFLWGDPGAIASGPAFEFNFSFPSASSAGDRCGGLEEGLRGAAAPVLYSAPESLRMPAHRLRNGSRLVANTTLAGVFLDQVVGRLCHPPFKSPWLRSAVSRER